MTHKTLYVELDDITTDTVKVKHPIIKFKAYDLIERAVEEGIASGWRRAHKYEDVPSEISIQENIGYYVMLALEQVIDFSEDCSYE